MSTENLSTKEISQLVEAVGGPAGARNLIAGFLRLTKNFPTWGKLVVGGSPYCPKGNMVAVLKQKKYLKDVLTEKVIRSRNYQLSRTKQDLELVCVSVSELGLTDGGFLSDIIAVAKSRELIICPQETAPKLMLEMTPVWAPQGGSIIVASNPIVYEEQGYLLKISERRITHVTAYDGNHIEPTQSFIFCRE